MIDPDLWTTADVAAWCQVTPSTIRAYVVRGEIPAPGRVGRTMVWEPETITSWRPGGGRRDGHRH